MSASAPASLPPGLQLYQLAVGHYVSRALALAAKLGVADQLADGPLDAAALAARLDCEPGPLARVLRLLVSVGVFQEEAGRGFANNAVAEALRRDRPDSMRAAVMLFAGPGIQENWSHLEYCVRTGNPYFLEKDPKATPFDHAGWTPDEVEVFDEAMAAFTRQTALAVAAAIDFSDVELVVDVGGGNGALLIGLLGEWPKLHGVVLERPEVAARARQEIERAGLADRCRAEAGDFFTTTVPGADAYLAKHVIHDWNDADATRILERCREGMKPESKLWIVEGIYPEQIDRSIRSRGAAANDVNMLVVAGGRQRTESEFAALFAGAGLRLSRIVPTLSTSVVIEAVPA